jgi:hypothetical protein
MPGASLFVRMAIVVGLLCVLPSALTWAAPKQYAYLLVQGTITDPSTGKPLPGAIVRMSSENSGSFEDVTDEKGVFVFEKLPLGTFDMSVTRSDGEVVRWIQPIDRDLSNLHRFRVGFGRGEEQRISRIEANEEGATIVAEAPPVRWKRFWRQFGVFLGCAALLAL